MIVSLMSSGCIHRLTEAWLHKQINIPTAEQVPFVGDWASTGDSYSLSIFHGTTWGHDGHAAIKDPNNPRSRLVVGQSTIDPADWTCGPVPKKPNYGPCDFNVPEDEYMMCKKLRIQ